MNRQQPTTDFHILNLGAGVQSTALYLLDADGELKDELGIKFTHAIFADTQEEPDSVYEHLEWLESLGGVPILKGTAGSLGDDVLSGDNSTGQKFVSIPAFQKHEDGSVGQMRRQCTSEYKITVVEQSLRRDVFGLKKRQRIPKNITFTQYMGFSYDEPGRAVRCKGRLQIRGWQVSFPLIDMQWNRHDCIRYLEGRVPHNVPRSACVFCPYRSDRSWLNLKENDPTGFARAVEVDEGLRKSGVVLHRDENGGIYLHRSCKPLKDANLGQDQGQLDFMAECEGGCGL